ncbi:hypothetical protein HGRIS_014405 [Hohenbuehelia grisea]|uniref:Uncharacterized protein n=1 Tax=Hohenbuehelia grisea TaxID=104357 RepID=A0ABR3JV29_9AGAR
MHPLFAFAALTYGAAKSLAANDWTKPCFDGKCFYDAPSADGPTETLMIWGSPNAISDITPAAGWVILGCDENALAQDIRIVCKSDDPNVGCGHLDQNGGPVDKIVRLPENCGKNAFARISKVSVPKNQTIPSDIASKLSRRDSKPEVLELTLDTDFGSVDPSKNGEVQLAVAGATVPGQNGQFHITNPEAVIAGTSSDARIGIPDFIEKAFADFSSFDKEILASLQPVSFNAKIPLFEEKLDCGPVAAFVRGEAAAKGSITVALGLAATGKIVPPTISSLGVFTRINGEVEGSLKLSAQVAGTLASKEKLLYSAGLPGLSFPGIITLGPSFQLLTQGSATLDVNMDVTAAFNYKMNDLQVFFPPSSKKQHVVGIEPLKSYSRLSVGPSVSSTGRVEAHIMPRLALGLVGPGGIAKANLFVELDASTAVSVNLQAKGLIGTKRGNKRFNAVASRSSVHEDDDSDASDGALLEVSRRSTSADIGANGCVTFSADLAANIGADASFFGIFDGVRKHTIAHKSFEIFQRCFEKSYRRRSSVSSPFSSLLGTAPQTERRALTCTPKALAQNLLAVIDDVAKPKLKA